MTDVSVIICTHNPRPHYLQRVLDSLRAQTFPKERWELILVDNASKEPLTQQFDLKWHPRGRHVLERNIGLSNARLCGMREAVADVLVFVDDDNVMQANYLAEAARIGAEWPRLGAWGSSMTLPEFEVEPSRYVAKITPYLALRDIKKPQWGNVLSNEVTPWGAGLCLRKSVADAYREMAQESGLEISGRKGKVLLSGDDVELSYVACDIGLGIGIFPELKVTHLIPRGRVEKDYLLRIVEGTGTSSALLTYKWEGIFPSSPLRPRGLLGIVKNLLVLKGIDREVYLAEVRAKRAARRMISELESRSPASNSATKRPAPRTS